MQKKSGKKEKDPGKDGKIIRGKKVLRRKTQISGKESVIPGIGEDKELMISKPQIAPAGRTGEKKRSIQRRKPAGAGHFSRSFSRGIISSIQEPSRLKIPKQYLTFRGEKKGNSRNKSA